MNKIRAGVIGGGAIAECHLRDMQKGNSIVPWAICDVNPVSLNRTGEAFGIPQERRFTDYKELLAQPDVDMVTICTPNVTHYEIALEAVKSGKPYALEKPVSMTLEEAEELNKTTAEMGLVNTVCFSYRYLPAVVQAKRIIESGALGKIHHVYAQYIEGKDDNENIPLLWRYQKELAGSGSLGDLGSHMLDMMRHLVGDFKTVTGTSGIVVPQRQKLDGSGLGTVTTEDWFHAMATMENGISATMAFTKFAWGRKNSQRLEIYGSQGGLIFSLEKGIDSLQVCLGEQLGLTGDWVNVTLERNIPSQMDSFGEILQGGSNATPADITDGYYIQAVMEAMLSAEANKTWCNVDEFVATNAN